ncbi:amino acid permease [Gottfriedia acidiceleris]|uniref:amino acid permease n=1 Tax=Gottfriedia acidiceleris TaxID=371036 RepID=UPI002FFDF552
MENQNKGLQQNLKNRHIQMISIGGIIGAGLFVGSGNVIHSAGPSAIVAYVIAGVLVALLMRMLGEMAAENPDSGSFSTYAKESIGPWAGYTIGWLYWFFWLITIAIEAIAGANIMNSWFPSIPLWGWALILTFALTLTNILSVKTFGEFEYWFAITKVVAISAFMLLGLAILFKFIPTIQSPGLSNLTQHGGFFPKGVSAILGGFMTVMFAFFGSEIAAIAAGESKDPQKSVVTAINSVVWRVALFYIGSVAILVLLMPWNDAKSLSSPYVTLLTNLGIPGAATIMKIVVLFSVLSCLNSALYTNSRMLYSLAKQGNAPRIFTKVNKGGSPYWAVWASSAFAFLAAIFNFISPDKLFSFLLNASGSIALLVYIVIAVSHLIKRREAEKKGKVLRLKMWGFPYITYISIIAMVVIYFSMFFMSGLRSQFYLTSFITVLVISSFFIFKVGKKEKVESKHEELIINN